jgi:hypothetical protein
LARKLKKSSSTVSHQLKALKDLGIAAEHSHRWYAVPDVNIAELRGTSGTMAKIKERHGREREMYAELKTRKENQLEIRKANALWARTKPAATTVVEAYLQNRGISGALPDDLRYLGPAEKPSMAVAVRDAFRLIVGVELTPLLPDGSDRDRSQHRNMVGIKRGGAVRLAEPRNGILCLAEGVETGLAVIQGNGLPCWATCGAAGLSSVKLPPEVRLVVICADNDPAGLVEADKAAEHFRREGRDVRTVRPDSFKTDFNDLARSVAALFGKMCHKSSCPG